MARRITTTRLLAASAWVGAWLFYDRIIQRAPAQAFGQRLSLVVIPITLCALGSLALTVGARPPRLLPQSGPYVTLYRGVAFLGLTAIVVLAVWAVDFGAFSG